MSVPEHVRYRNSTMFVGTPPFGYEGTDDRTSPFWHPPMTPPHEMRHRTMSYPSVPRSTTSNRSITPVTSDSLKVVEQKAPEYVMTDVVPALFSSPKIGPHLAQCTNNTSDGSRLDMTDVQQSTESCDEISGTRRDSLIEKAPMTSASCLPFIPELTADDGDDQESLTTTPRVSSRRSSGNGSLHVHTFLRCPRCDHLLKWVFIDQLVDDVQTHGLQAGCDCGSTLEPTKTYKPHGQESEVVQVNRGAWMDMDMDMSYDTLPTDIPSRPKVPRRSISKSQTSASPTKKPTRIPHNLIERRYRRNLQDHLDHLASKIPGWGMGSPRGGPDLENANFAIHRRSKASAMAAAAKHIDDLDRDIAKKDDFVEALQEQIQGLQKLVSCDDCSIVRCLQAGARNPSSDFLVREYGSAGI
ncbi:hypothetical protein Q7P35_006818 [Cladosporium inversicolor]